MLEKLKTKFKLKFEYVVAIILLVVILVVATATFGGKNEQTASDETQAFVGGLEKKLKASIENISGVKSASVSITVDGGVKTVIAEDLKTVEQNGIVTTTSSPVIISGEPIVLGKTYPKIVGVVIVCNCKSSLLIEMSVLDIVTTMLGVPCEKVQILTQ